MSETADRIFTGRYRVAQYACDVFMVLVGAIFAIEVGRHWAWGPFVVAIAIFALGITSNDVIWRAGVESLLSPQARHRFKTRRRLRYTVLIPAQAAFALTCGLVSGSVPTYTLDVWVGVAVLVFNLVLPLALVSFMRRRAIPDDAD